MIFSGICSSKSINESNEFADVWSTDSVRNLAESKRKCRFPDEGDMMYYRNYTRNNCMLECVHRFIQEVCGCQPYFHPSEDLLRYCKVLD